MEITTEKELRNKIGIGEKELVDTDHGFVDIFEVKDNKVSYGFLSNGKIVTEDIDIFMSHFNSQEV